MWVLICLVAKSCSTLYNPMDCNWPGSFVHGISQTRIPDGLLLSFPGDFPNQASNPCLLLWQADFFIAEPSWKPLGLHWEQQTISLILKSSTHFKVLSKGKQFGDALFCPLGASGHLSNKIWGYWAPFSVLPLLAKLV